MMVFASFLPEGCRGDNDAPASAAAADNDDNDDA